MIDSVRMGVVGAGSISLRGILPHLTQKDLEEQVRVEAICDPEEDRAKRAAEKFDVPHHFKKYDDLLESAQIDAVTIASPIGIHFKQGKKAIKQGIHVHFNKTMTTNLEDANELVRLADENNVKLVSSPGEMVNPLNQKIKSLVENGAIGEVTWAVTGSGGFANYHLGESVRQGDDVLSNINPGWYFRSPGGGPLYDVVVYGLHSLTGILGPAQEVRAVSGLRIPEREFNGESISCEMDDNTLILLDFGDAVFGFVYGTAAGTLPSMTHPKHPTIFGTEGIIQKDKLNGEPIEFEGREDIDSINNKNELAKINSTLPHVKGNHKNIQEAHVFEDIMQLVDWIRKDKSPLATADHARHVIDIIESSYRSAETGKAVKLNTSFELPD